MKYTEFLASKRKVVSDSGHEVDDDAIHPSLFDFQRAIVQWSERKGRAAVFADTGLGKTRMQIEWARLTGERPIILAPLAVAHQTIREATSLDVDVANVRDKDEAATVANRGGIPISNYERLHLFDLTAFGAAVLDESSILKSFSGTTKKALVKGFKDTPYRLACTATPAPNDLEELCNHADFLGVMKPSEMRSTFFIADSRGSFMKYRLKRHAKDAFFQWLASWAMAIKKPSDLGFDDRDFTLPGLDISPHFLGGEFEVEGALFATKPKGVSEQAAVRRATMGVRIERTIELALAEPDEQWLIWCGMNEEARRVAAAIPGAINVEGADSPETKAEALLRFADGGHRVLVTKPTIAGFGMNFQACARMAFVGIGHSYEQYYQALRRCHRFGQKRVVHAHVVLADIERDIYETVLAKEQQASELSSGLLEGARDYEMAELFRGTSKGDDYEPRATAPAARVDGGSELNHVMDQAQGDGWALFNGDSAEVLPQIPDQSVDLSVFSPPFSSTYTYSPSDRDLGNVGSDAEFWEQFRYVSAELVRVMKPGRLVAVHVANLPTYAIRDGASGRKDFRGDTIRHFVEAGFVYHSEITIDKNPQAQAIRTHSKGLLFVQKNRDAAALWQAWADYVCVFRAPGDNAEPVRSELTDEDWIDFARPVWPGLPPLEDQASAEWSDRLAGTVWYGIRETDVLSAHGARDNDDERHLCPLQLPVIERCVKLWSNKGDVVLSPFAGIGSEGVGALRQGRRFIGIELKPSYWKVACENLRKAETEATESTLFASAAL